MTETSTTARPVVGVGVGVGPRLLRRAALTMKLAREHAEDQPYSGDVTFHRRPGGNWVSRQSVRMAARRVEAARRDELRENILVEIVSRAGLLDPDFVEPREAAVAETIRANVRTAVEAAGGWPKVEMDETSRQLFDAAERARQYDRSLAEDGLKPDEEYEKTARERIDGAIAALGGEVRSRIVETLKIEKNVAEAAAIARRDGRRGRPRSRRPGKTVFEEFVVWNARRGAGNLEKDPGKAVDMARANSVLQWGALEALAAVGGRPSARNDRKAADGFRRAAGSGK